MWKVSFKDPKYKKVQKFNDRVTVVTLKGDMQIPIEVITSMPKEVYDWMSNKINPKVQVYHWQGIISITATGKAVKSEDDKDDPVLAERIAECRAKIAIYKFVTHLIEKYNKYYIKLIIGKYGSTRPDYNQKDTPHSIHGKYSALCGKELKHLEELFDLVKNNG